mmetsp:Transcript_19775/g.36430  ORF Transcript_19775/g.36430 Transcript_19775/m.36430 type:complete len:2240 (+) Transcript_19775:1474-8193(+)
MVSIQSEYLSSLVNSLGDLQPSQLPILINQLYTITEGAMHNACVISHAEDTCKFVSRLIELHLANHTDFNDILLYLKYLVSRCGVRKEYFTTVYRTLLERGAQLPQLMASMQVLKTLLNQPGALDPLNYFFFSGQTQGLRVMHHPNYPFVKAFSCCFWIRLERVGAETMSKLFVMHCDERGGVEAYFIGTKLYVRLLPAEYKPPTVGSNGVLIHNFRTCEWTYVALLQEHHRFGRQTLRAVIDGEDGVSAPFDFPLIKSASPKLNYAAICEGFFGQLACCMFFNEPVGISKLKSLYVNYTVFGPQTHESIRSLHRVFDKTLTSSIALFFHPLRASSDFAFEGVSKNDAAITSGAGVKLNKPSRMAFFGGLSGLMPLLELILSQPEDRGALLYEWLELLFISLRDNPDNQVEAYNLKLFKAVAEVLTRFDAEFFTETTVAQLGAIVYNVMPNLRDQIAVDLLWNLGFWRTTEAEKSVLTLLKSLYSSTPKSLSQKFGIARMLDEMFNVYDTVDHSCCNKHGGEGDLSFVTEAFSTIIESVLRVQPQEIQYLVNAMYLRTAPCIQSALLGVICRIFKSNGEQSPLMFYKYFIDCKGCEMLLYVIFSSRNESKALCLQCINSLVRLSPKSLGPYSRKDVMIYLSAIISPQAGRFDERLVARRSSYYEESDIFESVSDDQMLLDKVQHTPTFNTDRPPKSKWEIDLIEASNSTRRLNLDIDTDSINQGYTYGGEKGRKIKERADFIAEITSLSNQCLKYQRGEAPLALPTRSKSLQFRSSTQPTKSVMGRRSLELKPAEIIEGRPDDEATLYISVLQLVLQRPLSPDAMLDDADVITNVEALALLLAIAGNSSQFMQQRLVQDLLMLTKWNANNKTVLSRVSDWQTWLLKLVLSAQADTPTNLLIRDMGYRLHTSVALQSYSTDDSGWLQIRNLLMWVESVRPHDYDSALHIARHLVGDLIEGLKTQTAVCRPGLCNAAWKNIVMTSFLIQELVMFKSIPDSNSAWQLLSLDFTNATWQDFNMVLAFFDLCEPIWPKGLMETSESPTLLWFQQLTLAIRRSSKHNFKADYQLLLFEPNGEFKTRGCFLNVVIQLLSLALSATSEASVIADFLGKQQRIFNFVLLVSEASYKQLPHSAAKTFKQALCFILGHTACQFDDAQDPNLRTLFKRSLFQCLSCLFSCHLQVMDDQPRAESRASISHILAGYNSHVSTQVIKAMSELSRDSREIDNEEIRKMQLTNYSQLEELIDRDEWRELLKALHSSVQESILSLTTHASFSAQRSKGMMKLRAAKTALHSQNDVVVKGVQDKVLNLAAEFSEAEELRRQAASAYAVERFRQRRKLWLKMKDSLQNPVGAWATNKPTKLVPHLVFNCELARPWLKMKTEENSEYIGKNDDSSPPVDTIDIKFLSQIAAQQDIAGEAERDEETQEETTDSMASIISPADSGPFIHSPSRKEPQLKSVMANDHSTFHKEVGWVTPLCVRYGLLEIVKDNTTIRFVSETSSEQKFVAHLSICKYRPAKDKPCVKEWHIDGLIQILPRTYVLRKTALEFFFSDGRSYLFNFSTPHDRDDILTLLTSSTKKLKAPGLSRVFTGRQSCAKIIAKSGLTEKWASWQMSNFEYLLHLNFIAGRSFHDLTQYPVMPWVLSDYNSRELDLNDPNVYRDLSKPMGALGSRDRTDFFIDRYQSTIGGPEPAFHYGSHYSNPGIILHYLVRLYPYSQGFKELHDGKFDLPDRLFSSINEAYRMATEDISDVKELIPEFYFLPEFLLNIEDYDFGYTQMGEKVHNVKLPPWATDAYDFVRQMREALESDHVSAKLNEWIDLIFGYKQQGEAAQAALNAFFYMTYEGSVDLDKVSDPSLRNAMEAQVVHFGRTPSQLFTKPHPKRQLKPPTRAMIHEPDLKLYFPDLKKHNPAQLYKNYVELPDHVLIYAEFIAKNKIAGLRSNGSVTSYTWAPTLASDLKTPFTLAKERDYRLSELYQSASIETRDRSLNSLEAPVAILKGGKILVQGGYWDGRLTLNYLESKQAKTLIGHSTTITCLDVDEEETLAMTGSKDGEVILWTIEKDSWRPKLQYYDHSGPVTSVRICRSLQSFASVGEDGRCMNYSLISGRLLRMINMQSKPIKSFVFSPVTPSKIILFVPTDHSLYSFSVNGTLLHKARENSQHIIRPIVLKDQNWKEYLVYGTDSGDILIRGISNLMPLRRLSLPNSFPILSLFPTQDLRILFAACGYGEVTVLAPPNMIA